MAKRVAIHYKEVPMHRMACARQRRQARNRNLLMHRLEEPGGSCQNYGPLCGYPK